MQETKTFKYDVLIEREDICDRKIEMPQLTQNALQNKRIILLAPRRYGKTSLIKNVVAKDFKKSKKNAVVIYIDLMDVGDLQSIANRLQKGIAKSLMESFPLKTMWNQLAGFFKQISLNIEFDPISGNPSLNLSSRFQEEQKNIEGLLDAIERIANQYPLMLILDEFQDVAFVKEAEVLFRGLLQQLKKTSVFVLGSKRHLLERIFLDNKAPLFQYGDEIHLDPIPLEDWLPYFKDRLRPKKIQLEEEEMRLMMDKLYHVPNALCELGAWLVEYYSNIKLTPKVIQEALDTMVEKRQSYAYRLQAFTKMEKKVLSCIASVGFVATPHSVEFIQKTGLPKSSVGKALHQLLDFGVLEYELKSGYRISDPIFAHYLSKQ